MFSFYFLPNIYIYYLFSIILLSRLHNFNGRDEPVVNIVGLQLWQPDHDLEVGGGEDAHHGLAGRDEVVSAPHLTTVLVSKQILQVGRDDLIYLYFETSNVF